MSHQNRFEIVGVGAPIVDQVLFVNDAFLSTVPGMKGGMVLVSDETLSQVIAASESTPTKVCGGSASNTIKGLANLGHQCSLIGMVGMDPLGVWFSEKLIALKIFPQLVTSKTTRTSQVLCLVTPDGQRTMRTFIGASSEINPEDLHEGMFEGARLVHIEGYTLLKKNLTLRAMEMAKRVGAKISFDLSSFEMTKNYKVQILHLLENFVDILFANEDETKIMTHLAPEAGCKQLMNFCETVVVLQGPHGCWVGRSGEQIHAPAFAAKPLDTTGAGDLFASGFLHGYLNAFSLETCANMGNLLGAAAVHTIGAEIPEHIWKDVHTFRTKIKK